MRLVHPVELRLVYPVKFRRTICPGLAELARENAGCEVIEGDFETYDFSSILVDAIMVIGALVHLPHERFPKVFANITSAISDNGSVLITLKEGSGDLKDPDGRIFYLWVDQKARELFDTLGFKVCDFSTSVSKTGSGDVWMSYVLDKTGRKKCYGDEVNFN
ncbi:MAG: class I SAM-dependent methyltransferase [Thermodesulfobacteriota bacterium]|nr:class I SAM-dependent methyltransferase [Thermodesulfobacteriota bacterium]